MIPLQALPTIKAVAALAAVALAAYAGWTARGWKADAEINALRTTIAQSTERAVTEARTIEHTQQEAVNGILAQQNEDLRGIADRLRVDLERLRKRPERGQTAAGVPAAPGAGCACGTGTELCRSDAEFLVREAARADEIRAGLIRCYEAIDATP